MAGFDELQTLWQSQTAVAPPAFDAAAAAGAFRRYGRKQDIINTCKLLLIAGVMVQAVITSRHRPVIMFAVMLMLCSGLLALITEWRNQRAIASFDFSAPSVAFVRDAIARLQGQQNPLQTREYRILFFAVFTGYNLMVVSAYPHTSMGERILGHSIGLTLPVLIYVVGRAVRQRRWEAECRPLLGRLTVLLETLEENAR